MNTASDKPLENGKQRRKSMGSSGGSNLVGGQNRRYSIGVTSSRKSIGGEGNIVPNYLRASTGSCHDFCKFGKKHELLKSSVPVKFKRTTVVDKAEPVKVTKKDVLLASKKPQGSFTNGLKTSQRSMVVKRQESNGGIEKKNIKTVKKTGITPKTVTVKKVVAKVTSNGSLSPKASVSRAASLKGIKSRGVKQLSPIKDQNRMQKSEIKVESKEFDFVQSSTELVNTPVCDSSDSFSDKNVVEESQVILPVNESSQLFSDKQVVEELLVVESSKSCSDKESLEEEGLITPPLSESSESFYDDEVLENDTDDEETEVSDNKMEDGSQKITRRGKMVISEDKDDAAVKLRFRRGKILDVQNEEKQRGASSVVLKHQGEQEKKDGKGLLNNVIEETASKLVESRKSKVKALVGAFETVISLHDGKPSST